MISIPERWLPRWQSTVQSRAVCWEITRTDGQAFRFTSWDRPIWIGSSEFLPRDDNAEDGGGQFSGDTRAASLREHSAGLDGVITSAGISDDDLRNGLFDNATLRIYAIDASNPSAGYSRRTFQVADIEWNTDGRWQFAVVSSIDSAIQQQRGEVVSRTCRNTLFGTRCARARTPGGSDGLVGDEWDIGQASGNFCTVSEVTDAYTIKVQIPAATISAISTGSAIADATAFTTATNHYFAGEDPNGGETVHPPLLVYGNVGASPTFNGTWSNVQLDAGSPDRNVIVYGVDVTTAGSTLGFACLAPESGWFDRGWITWQTGDNAGQVVRVASSGAFVADPSPGFGGYVTLTLDAAPLTDVTVGDTCTLRVGCDGGLVTCEEKFGNVVNFNGEPFTPSADILLNTPSAN